MSTEAILGIGLILGIIISGMWRFLFGIFLIVGVVAGFNRANLDLEKVLPEPVPIVTSLNNDSNIHQTAFDPSWFVRNWFSYKATEAIDKKLNAPEQPRQIVEEEIKFPVKETPEMLEYVKHCTDLTNDPKLCQDNWNSVASTGNEIILSPVERTVQRKTEKAHIQKISTKVPKEPKEPKEPKAQRIAKSKVNEVKLLDVDNEEYKARRAAALAKPNAIVIHETYR